MKISKQIMNPARVHQLKILAKRDNEMNAMALANKSHSRLQQVELSVQRFGELGLIVYTGGGFFAISDKGRGYLNELAKKEAEKTGDDSFKPDYAVPPAETMMEALADRGITLEQLSEESGISLDQWNGVVNAIKPIQPTLAEALENATGINHRFWLKLESNYQLTLTRLGEKART